MKDNKKKYIAISAFGIVGLFFLTYYVVTSKIESRNLEYLNTVAEETSANKSNEVLKDDLKVSFYTDNSKDKVTTIKGVVDEYKIADKKATEATISSAVASKGYKMLSKSDEGIIFKREAKDSLEKNTYYIGEKDGYLAIYKTDDKGNMNVHKVYSDYHGIDNLRENDIDKIKNYQYFNSTDLSKVEEMITELTT
ncbi:MAG: hypothetical protein RR628_00405 [Clostridium sp.]|uniref:hypothetical protein n=1 Tax=Clostridium sp. TaxID=1506 RepID=UPI002FC5DE70